MIGAAGGGLVVLVTMGILGYYFIAGPGGVLREAGYPEDVRKAHRLYRAGKYREAYDAAQAYLIAAGFEADMRAALEERSKPGKDAVHPEGYFLTAKIALLNLTEMPARPHLKLLDRAVAIDSGYTSQAVELLSDAINQRLSVEQEEALIQKAVDMAKGYIAKDDYVSLSYQVQKALQAGRPRRSKPTDLVEALAKYDAGAAAGFRRKAAAHEDAATVLHRQVVLRVLPDLVNAVRGLTEEQLKEKLPSQFVSLGYRRAFEDIPRFVAVAFADEKLAPTARELFNELHRCFLFRHGPIGRTAFGAGKDASIRQWVKFTVLAVHHPDVLLPPLLTSMKRNGDIANALLYYTPKSTLNYAPLSERRKPIPRFDDAHTRRINEAIADLCVKTLLSHAQQASEQNIRAYCSSVWAASEGAPDLVMRLAQMAPDLLEKEDFLFAMTWSWDWRKNHEKDSLYYLPLEKRLKHNPFYKHDLSYYLAKYPQGKYAQIARRGTRKSK